MRACSRLEPRSVRAVRPSAASTWPCHCGRRHTENAGGVGRLRARSEIQMQAAAGAAGASRLARLLKAAAKLGAGCPSFGGQRTALPLRNGGTPRMRVASAPPGKKRSSNAGRCLWPLAEPTVLRSRAAPKCIAGAGAGVHEHAHAQAQAQAQAIWGALPALVCFGMQTQGTGAAGRAWPNPSIEGTASGLRPPAAPHVKR